MKPKFPYNDIMSLLDVDLKHNLGESTSQDLVFGELLDEELIQALQELRLGYGSSQGLPQLREVLGEKLAIDPDKLLITNGAVAGIFLSVFCLCGEEDEIIVTTPNFPPTIDIINAIGAVKKDLTFRFGNQYQIDLDELSSLVTEKTRLIILVSPHNPSGKNVEPKDIDKVLQIMQQQAPEAYLLIDETYREAMYSDEPPHPSAANLSDKIITTASLSKCHGAPGLRIGWLSCHDDQLLQQLTIAKLNTVISCSVVDEVIGLHVLKKNDLVLSQRQALLKQAIATVETWVDQQQELIEWVKPDAGALCCVRLRDDKFSGEQAKRFQQLAAQHQVQIAFGEWFQDEGRIFRIGFGYPKPADLKPALDALTGLLNAVLSE